MAQDIDLLGAVYPDVPAVQLPKDGGGTALFTDVSDTTADASDVADGEVFYTSAGLRSAGTGKYAAAPVANGNATRTNGVLFGRVDSTSTSTVFTATVDGLTELYDGVCIMLDNNVVNSASGFTLNVNNLGALPVYYSLNDTRQSTMFNLAYTLLFYYDSQKVSGGAWVVYGGYDTNTNTIGYQLRTNSGNLVAADTGYRYRIWLTSADGSKWVPINTSTSTNSTTARTLNTRKIDPFGPIAYRATNGTCSAGTGVGATGMWLQYTLTIGYSYVVTLTYPAPVYLQCTPQSDGSAVMNNITQALPTTNDGKIYIHLGTAYSATAMELQMVHPVYWHDGTAIRLWTGAADSGGGDVTMTEDEVDAAVDAADYGWNGTAQITNGSPSLISVSRQTAPAGTPIAIEYLGSSASGVTVAFSSIPTTVISGNGYGRGISFVSEVTITPDTQTYFIPNSGTITVTATENSGGGSN